MMNGQTFLLSIAIIFLTLSCADDGNNEDGVAFGEAAFSGFILSPGMISTELPEFATSVSENGDILFFNRTSGDRRYIQIYYTRLVQSGWETPQPISFSDTAFIDVDPFLSYDGKRLYFSSNRPAVGFTPKDFDLWYTERIGDGWGIPVNLKAPFNTDADEVFCSLARNGNLYFSRREGEEPRKIYRSVLKNGVYQAPELVNIPVGDSVSVGNPCISPDESFLVFVTADLPGEGGPDLFVTTRGQDDTWSPPVNPGQGINSPYADFAPHLSADGEAFYFTSERPGMVEEMEEAARPPGDIYMVQARGNLKD